MGTADYAQWTQEVKAPMYGAYETERISDGCVWIPECTVADLLSDVMLMMADTRASE